MTVYDKLLALLCVTLWGMNAVAIKIAVVEIPPILLISLRFIIVAAIILPFSRPPLKEIKKIILFSILMGMGHFGLWFYAVSGLDASTAAVVIQAGVPICAIFSAIIFKDDLGVITMIAVGICIAGVFVIAGGPTMKSSVHLFAAIASATFWALGTITIKYIKNTSPFALTGSMSLLSAFELLLVSHFVEGPFDFNLLQNASPKTWIALIYTVICASIIAHSTWNYLVGKYNINKIVFYGLLAPVVGIFSGAIALSETITYNKIIGAIMIIGGIIIIEIRKINQAKNLKKTK